MRGDAEKFGDHRHRKRYSQVSHEVGLAPLGLRNHSFDEFGAGLPESGFDLGNGSRSEGS
jgi:hypothetical protein